MKNRINNFNKCTLVTIMFILTNVLHADLGFNKVEIEYVTALKTSTSTSAVASFILDETVLSALTLAAGEFVFDPLLAADAEFSPLLNVAGSQVLQATTKYLARGEVTKQMHKLLDGSPDQLKVYMAACRAGYQCDKDRNLLPEKLALGYKKNSMLMQTITNEVALLVTDGDNLPPPFKGKDDYVTMKPLQLWAPPSARYDSGSDRTVHSDNNPYALYTVSAPTHVAKKYTHGDRIAFIGLDERDCPGGLIGCDNNDVNDDLGTVHVYSFQHMYNKHYNNKYRNEPGKLGNGTLYITPNYYIRTITVKSSKNKSIYRVRYKVSNTGSCIDLNGLLWSYYNEMYPKQKSCKK